MYLITVVYLLQHFLLGVKFVLALVIPDVPQWVQDEMARQQYKAQLALRVSLRLRNNSHFYVGLPQKAAKAEAAKKIWNESDYASRVTLAR